MRTLTNIKVAQVITLNYEVYNYKNYLQQTNYYCVTKWSLKVLIIFSIFIFLQYSGKWLCAAQQQLRRIWVHLCSWQFPGLAQDGTDARSAQLSSGVGLGMVPNPLYIFCFLEYMAVVWKYSRQIMMSNFWLKSGPITDNVNAAICAQSKLSGAWAGPGM